MRRRRATCKLVPCDLSSVIEEAHRLSVLHTLKGGHRSFDLLHVAAARIVDKASLFLGFRARQPAEDSAATVWIGDSALAAKSRSANGFILLRIARVELAGEGDGQRRGNSLRSRAAKSGGWEIVAGETASRPKPVGSTVAALGCRLRRPDRRRRGLRHRGASANSRRV